MRFLADECCDGKLVRLLRWAGHDVSYVAERTPGVTDDEVLSVAYLEDRILITEDKEFAAFAFSHEPPLAGLILIRAEASPELAPRQRIVGLLHDVENQLIGSYVVIGQQNARIKPLGSARGGPRP